MAINKIKIQQIDADISGIIYEASTGHFIQTGLFYDFSGKSLSKQEFSGERIVFSTGNQDISGSKNFISRPTFNGENLSLQSEGLQVTGDQDVLGKKSFLTGAYFYEENVFSNSDIVVSQSNLDFQNSNFSFSGSSLDNFSNSCQGNFLLKTGVQDISGFKRFNDGIYLSGQSTLSGYDILSMQHAVGGFLNFTGANLSVAGFEIRNNANSSLNVFENTRNANNLYLNFYDTNGDLSFALENTPNTTKLAFGSGHRGQFKTYSDGSTVSPIGFETNYFSFSFNELRIFNFILSGNKFGPRANDKFVQDGDNIYASFCPLSTLSAPAASGVNNEPSGKNIALGLPSYPWSEIYCYNAPNIVSDRNEKTLISGVPDNWLDIWEKINYSTYKFKNSIDSKGEDKARWHFGIIAQDIYEEFQKSGINAFDFGLLGKTSWDAVYDDEGVMIKNSGERWMVRPDECQFLELALMRREISRLKSGNN